jgi:hypothetical protein
MSKISNKSLSHCPESGNRTWDLGISNHHNVPFQWCIYEHFWEVIWRWNASGMRLSMFRRRSDSHTEDRNNYFALQSKAVPIQPCRLQGGEVQLVLIDLSQHLIGWVVSVSPRPLFTPGTHWTGGCVGPRADLDTETRGKILCLCQGLNPIHPVCSQAL